MVKRACCSWAGAELITSMLSSRNIKGAPSGTAASQSWVFPSQLMSGLHAQAHTAAAAAIQAANNKDKGPWELDLHGLHVAEAIDAVHARLTECRSLQTSTGSPHKLRIIVGKGNHSSLGEASLPRVIAGVLSKQSVHFDHIGGIISVSLRKR